MANLQFPNYQKSLCEDLKKTFLKRASDTDPTRSADDVVSEVSDMLSTDIAVYAEKLLKEMSGSGFEGLDEAEDGAVLTYDAEQKKWVGKVSSGYVTRGEWDDFISGTDADNVINRWSEVENFLSGMRETDNLDRILRYKMDVDVFSGLFTALDSSGVPVDLSDKDAISRVATIRANYGFWSVDFVSALGKSTGSDIGGGSGVEALYELVDVKPNDKGDGVLGAKEGTALIYDGTHWVAGEAGFSETQLNSYLTNNGYVTKNDVYTKKEVDALLEALRVFEKVNVGTEGSPRYALHILESMGLYSDDFISALGKSTTDGTGGGGVSYERLDSWEDYDESKNEWVLSAGLGYGLRTDIATLAGEIAALKGKSVYWSDIKNTPTTLKGYGITDAYTKSEVDAMVLFEKVNIGTETNPVWAIHAKDGMGVYSDKFISALGVSGIGDTTGLYNRLDSWSDYDEAKAEWVLSAYLGYTLNTRVTALEVSKKGHTITINGSGNIVTNVLENGNTLTFTKGDLSFARIIEKPTTIAGYGITDAKITNGVITLGGSTITPLTAESDLAWNKIKGTPTTLSGYGITDGVNDYSVSGAGNAFTGVSLSGHTITFTKGETFLPKGIFDELFERVNVGTEDSPVYAIRAKYGLYSDSFITAMGYGSSSTGVFDRLDNWDDYDGTNDTWVLSAYLGNDLNERVTYLEDNNSQGGHTIVINGSGNVLTDVAESGNNLIFTKGNVEWDNILNKPSSFIPSAHTHAISKITNLQATLDGKASASHTHSYLPLSGGTMTGVITSSFASGTWINGVTNAIIKASYTTYGAVLSMPVKDGRVSISSYPSNDNYIHFVYATAAQISAGTNSPTKKMYWDAANNNLYADEFTGALSGNADTATNADKLDGNHASAFAAAGHTHSYLPLSGGKLTGSLEINATGNRWNEGIRIHPASNGWNGVIFCGIENTGSSGTSTNTWNIGTYGGGFYMNRNAGGNENSAYILCNVNGNWGMGTNSPSYKLHVAGDIYTTTGFKKNGSSDSYVLLGGGGHKAESSLSVSYASSAGNASTATLPYGFTSRDSDWMGNCGMPGTYITAWGNSGGSIGFKVDGGHINVATDGYFYHGIDIYGGALYRCLDTHDSGGYGLITTGNYTSYCAPASHTHSYLSLSGGTLTGCLHIARNSGSAYYNENIRMHSYNGWTSLMFCGSDNTADNGTSANSWSMHTYQGNFYLNRNGSNSHTEYELCNVDKYWGIGVIKPSYTLDIYSNRPSLGDIINLQTTSSWCSILYRCSSSYLWSVGNNSSGNFVFYCSSLAKHVVVFSANGDITANGGITMYSDLRKKNILSDEVLSVKEIAAAPLFSHTYKSDENHYLHVGTSAQYWSSIHDNWFTRKDSEGYYQMELQNLGVAMGISLAREIVTFEGAFKKYESKTDKKIRLMKKKINDLEEANKALDARIKELEGSREERRTA